MARLTGARHARGNFVRLRLSLSTYHVIFLKVTWRFDAVRLNLHFMTEGCQNRGNGAQLKIATAQRAGDCCFVAAKQSCDVGFRKVTFLPFCLKRENKLA